MAEIKTKEWLKSQLEDGDILTAEVIREWLDSYWHKSEMGQVNSGDERPVSGRSVVLAIEEMRKTLEQKMRQVIADALPELLAATLQGYVTSEALNRVLQNIVTQTWVQQQLSDKVTQQSVTDALAEKVSVSALDDKVTTAALEEALSSKVSTSEMNTALAEKADASAVYTKTQIDAVVAARPTQTEMAGEMSATVADLPNNAIIQQLTAVVNALVVRTNKLSHVACGSEEMNVCLSDISQITRD